MQAYLARSVALFFIVVLIGCYHGQISFGHLKAGLAVFPPDFPQLEGGGGHVTGGWVAYGLLSIGRKFELVPLVGPG